MVHITVFVMSPIHTLRAYFYTNYDQVYFSKTGTLKNIMVIA